LTLSNKDVCKSTRMPPKHKILYYNSFIINLIIIYLEMIKKINQNQKGGIENGKENKTSKKGREIVFRKY